MAADIQQLSRRACGGDKEAQYALEAAAEELLAQGRIPEALDAYKEAITAFRIAAGTNEAQWLEAACNSRRLETQLELLRSWIHRRATFEPLPRADLPALGFAEFARALGTSSDHYAGTIASLAVEALTARGVVFFSPGGSEVRRLTVLLLGMASGRFSEENEALMRDPDVRVAMDLLADWAASALHPRAAE